MILEYEDDVLVVDPPKPNQKLKLIGQLITVIENSEDSYLFRKTTKYPYNDLFDKLYERSIPELQALLKLHKKQSR